MPASATASFAPPQSLRAWSTDAVAPTQRLDYWVGAICEAFLEMDCSSREAPSFSGTLRSQPVQTPVQTIAFNQVMASTQDVYRTSQCIARSSNHFYLITQLHDGWHVRQGGHVAHLRPGDTVLVDAAQAYELHFPQGVGCLSVQLPRGWVGQWLTQAETRCARTVPRDSGWGQSLSALCLQLGRDPTLANAMPAQTLSDHLGAVLAAALEPQMAAGQPARANAAHALYARLCSLLRQQLDQTGLQASDLARQAGVSPRTLHRAFTAQGATFAGTLRGLRLQHAAHLLAQPRLATLGVGEVGRRCGFADASHFVREFQRTYGTTPARWRRCVNDQRG